MHVEHELRRTLVVNPEAKPRFKVDLPDSYWDTKLTAKDIFREMEARTSSSALSEDNLHHVVQKLVILDETSSLVDYIYECSQALSQTKRETDADHVLASHMLRFFAHLVLVLRSVSRVTRPLFTYFLFYRNLDLSGNREPLCDSVLETYIKLLTGRKDVELVAFYTSKLPKSKQIPNFAKLLESIEDESDRKLCIVLAKNADLDIGSIAATVVDTVRTKAEEESGHESELLNATTTEDRKKINSVDWLLFSEVSEWSEALKQTNALMRSFLLMRKIDAMKESFVKLPVHIIDSVFKQSRRRTGSSELSADDDNAVREYLCHKAYLEANDAFTDWLVWKLS